MFDIGGRKCATFSTTSCACAEDITAVAASPKASLRSITEVSSI